MITIKIADYSVASPSSNPSISTPPEAIALASTTSLSPKINNKKHLLDYTPPLKKQIEKLAQLDSLVQDILQP
jgi:hypothetical protein